MVTLKRMCAWCGKDLGTIEGDINVSHPITHGICDPCSERMLNEVSEPLQSFLDRMEVPVLMINSDRLVVTGNKYAQKILGKTLSEIQGQTGGRVMQCVNAFTEEGCGKGVHCQSCTIRQTVIKTYTTGDPMVRVKAYPDIQMGDEIKNLKFEITTQKVGDFVLLRIDDTGPFEDAEHNH